MHTEYRQQARGGLEASGPATQNPRAMIVLGIDPGTASTGYGVVQSAGSRLEALDSGVIETRAGVAPERRLADIHARVGELLDEHAPDAVAIEELYFGANARTAFAVGQARGVVLLAAGQRGIAVALVHAAAGEGRGMRARTGGQGPGRADGRAAAEARRAAVARPRRRRARGGDLRAQPSAARARASRGRGDDRARLRPGCRPPHRPRRRRHRRRRLPPGRLGRDAPARARGGPGRRAPRASRRSRRRAAAVRVCHRGGARAVPDAARRSVGRPQGRSRGPVRRGTAGAAGRARRRRRRALPGRPGSGEADGRADHRRAPREGGRVAARAGDLDHPRRRPARARPRGPARARLHARGGGGAARRRLR